MTDIICSILLSGLFCFYILFHTFIQFDKREKGQKLRATVIEYRKEKIKLFRIDFVKIQYPYVEINSKNNSELICLRHASSFKRHYKIGEQVDVYWSKEQLLPWC